MPTERNILCGGAGGPPPCPDAGTVELDQFGPLRNARLRLGDIRGPLAKDVPPPLLDLLDVATYVYVAEQAVPRGRPTDADLGDRWVRRLFFRIPVRVPDLWAADATRAELEATLGFLTGDEFHFEFGPMTGDRPRLPQYLDFNGQTPFHGVVDEVVMFSGGLDSLGGAVREAVSGRRTLLVNHRSSGNRVPRHDRLVQGLLAHVGAARPEHAAVWVNKAVELNRAYEQRARSFLFAALGAVFAAQLDLPRVRFYENGVVSLNLPIAGHLVGARSTRTTHPKTLAGFGRLFGLVAGRPLAVENPFQWLTKADVVRQIAEAGCAGLIADTVSCASVWGRPARHGHCGRCSQCVDRRFAVLAAGRAADDPADDYEWELFTAPRPEPADRHLVTGYAETACAIERMTPSEFLLRYGQVARALRHAGEPAEEVARRVYDLHKRHAADVCRALDAATALHAAALRRGELPADCLLRLVVDPGAPPSDDPPPDEPPNYFRRHGEGWDIRYRGGRRFPLYRRKGLGIIHRLLSAPNRPHPALSLADETGESAAVTIPSAGEPIFDRQGRQSLEARSRELMEERERARRDNDQAKAERTDMEIAAVVSQLQAATGLHNRDRQMGDLADAARKAVSNAVASAIKAIRAEDAALADHLKASIKGGRSYTYAPADPVEWSL